MDLLDFTIFRLLWIHIRFTLDSHWIHHGFTLSASKTIDWIHHLVNRW